MNLYKVTNEKTYGIKDIVVSAKNESIARNIFPESIFCWNDPNWSYGPDLLTVEKVGSTTSTETKVIMQGIMR